MQWTIRTVLLALLLLSLAACGGDEEPAVEEAAPSTAQESTAEEPALEAAPETAVEEQTVEEAPEETSDSVAEEVEMDRDEDAEEGGAEEAHEDGEDEPTEIADTGSGWGESGSAAQSACDHPYLPLREGATWTYEATESEMQEDGTFSWEVASVEGDMDQATAVVLVTVEDSMPESAEDLTLEYTWECVAGQGISSFDFAGQNMATIMPEISMSVVNGEGEFLPNTEDLLPGYTWDSQFEQTLTFNMGEGDEQIAIEGDITTDQTSTVVGVEPITAAGVTVDGVQVEQVSQITIVMDVMGQSNEQTQDMTNNFEMGYGIGIMRQTFDSEFGPSGMELTSFFIP